MYSLIETLVLVIKRSMNSTRFDQNIDFIKGFLINDMIAIILPSGDAPTYAGRRHVCQ